MQTAISKRGVAVVAIPGDVAMRDAVEQAPRLHFSDARPSVCPSDDDLNILADLLNRSKKITILGGAGCAGAHDELIELAGKLQAPIVHAMRGKEFIEYDNPFDVGMTGLLGFSSGYHAMLRCEVLLMIGTDFPYQQFFPKDATIVQIDVRGEQIGRRCKVDFGFVGDTKSTLRALLPKLEQNQYETHLKESVEHYRKTRKSLDDLAVPSSSNSPIHPQYVARVLDQLASDDAVFTCDVGTPTIWAARYLTMNGKRRIIGSFTHGSMANALPQAIGAQASYPGRQVISMSGDGGFAMLMGDLLTLGQHQLPVKINRIQKRFAGVRRTGDEGGRDHGFQHRSAQPGLRENCGGSGPARTEGGNLRRRRADDRTSPQIRRSGIGRGAGVAAGTLHATDHHFGASEGLQPFHDESSSKRARGRNCRPGKGQSAPLRTIDH